MSSKYVAGIAIFTVVWLCSSGVQCTVPAFARTSVEEGPTFLVEPPGHVDFHNNTGAIIPCSGQGKPSPVVNWAHQDGTPLRDVVGLRHMRPDGSLVFPPFTAEQYRQDVHATVYRCLVTSSVGTISSREVHVRAVVQQRYKAHVYDEFVTKGNTAVFRCHVPAFVREYISVISWQRGDGTTINTSGKQGGRYSILSTGELYVRNVNQADSQHTYSCQTKHRLTGDIVTSATTGRLIVTEPHGNTAPKITDSHSSVTATEGDTVQLSCAAQAYPLPTYRWFKEEEGQIIPMPTDNRVSQLDGTLVLQYVVAQDSGRYICAANNSLGEERVRTAMTVTAPLSVYVYPQKQVVDVGKPATFNCTISGYPVKSVVWMKDQNPLPRDTRVMLLTRDILRILAVQKEDRGMYQCFVYNDLESAQGIAELRLGDVAPVLQSSFSEEAVQPDVGISLKCSASGNPLPEITWKLDDQRISDSARHRLGDFVTPDGRVVSYVNITDVRVEDGGEYSCTATNVLGNVTYSARVSIYGPPVIRPMRNVTVVAGETMTLRCLVAGHPVESVAWEKGGVALPANHRQKVELLGKLTVQNMQRPTDEGEYICIARGIHGQSARGSLYASILVAPLIDPQLLPQTRHANEGMKVKLVCSILQGDPPIRIFWSKNGHLLTASRGLTLQNLEDSSLVIFRKVSYKDSGNYTCIASNTAASVNRTTALVINVPPRWTLEPKDSFVVLGQQVSMDCVADGFPKPRITWKKARGKKPEDFMNVHSSYHRKVYGNGTFVILEVETTDGGYYLCQATNDVGAGLSKVVFLRVHIPPHFETNFVSQSVVKGESTILRCEATGELPLTVSWEKDKQPLDPASDKRYQLKEESGEGKVSSHLTVSSADRHDSALYTCTVSNHFGFDETNIQLIVQEVPSPPVDVQVRDQTSRSVTIAWAPSLSGNSIITKFVVLFQNSSASWEENPSQLVVPGTETVATARGLVPVTNYQFKVIAENAIGRSEPSDTVTATTSEEAPGGPPIDVEVHPAGSQSLKVTWKHPRKEVRHGVIQGYYIGYRMAESSEPYQYKNVEVPETSSGQHMSYLTNLKRHTQYSIIVQAYNLAGAGPRSDDVLATTLEASPPTSPVISVVSTSFDSITLQWETNHDGTSVIDYVLHYKAEGAEWEQQHLSISRGKYTLEGLQCGTRYRLYMTASNSLGSGEPSEPVTARTKGAAPVSPQKEDFVVPNTTSVTLVLTVWQDGGCPIKHFSVRYRSTFHKQWKISSESVGIEHQRYDIRHLVPGQGYNLRVSAHSEAGTTEAEYNFYTLNVTLPITTSQSRPPLVLQDGPLPFYKNLTVLLPVVISVTVLLVVIITVIVCLRRQTDTSSRGSNGDCHPRKGGTSENVGLTDFCQKGSKEQELYGKASYYSSPSRKPVATTASSRNHSEDDAHEYAEPYAAMSAVRCLTDEGDCRASLSVVPENERPYATIMRSPARPGSYLAALTQDGRSNRQMAPLDRQDVCNNSGSSQSTSGGRPSSMSSDSYRAFRQETGRK